MSTLPTIGHIKLTSRFLMAPMAGVTDQPFRKLVRSFGAALAASEMTTADQSLWTSRKSKFRLDFADEVSPRAVQIAGSEPKALAEAAQALEGMGVDIIDINMGCPAKKVCKALAGSALLRDETLVADILHAVTAAVSIPVTLKTRTGWSPERRNLPTVAAIARDAGIAALAVHGRTRACRYRGEAEFATIAKIREVFPRTLIANGDISSPERAMQVLEATGADAVMIGRAALGRPWIFRELVAMDNYGRAPTPLSRHAVRDMILGHLGEMHQFYGDITGVRVARKHLSGYCQHFAESDAFRYEVMRAETTTQQLSLTEKFLSFAEPLATNLGFPEVA